MHFTNYLTRIYLHCLSHVFVIEVSDASEVIHMMYLSSGSLQSGKMSVKITMEKKKHQRT